MNCLTFDTGVQEFQINGGGVLRFCPGDPNLYQRFLDAQEAFRELEQDLALRAKNLPEGDGAAALALLSSADRSMKELLGQVFGGENDFDALLGGVNLLAVAGNGKRVITNLLDALQPVLAQGAQSCAQQAVDEAKRNRVQV